MSREALVEMLQPFRMTEVVDIGANPIDGAPPYESMMDRRICRVTGFEPQEQALQALLDNKSDLETYLPLTLGDGEDQVLRVCAGSGMTSLLEPLPRAYEVFPALKVAAEVISRIPIQTVRLDDVDEVEAIDFLKLDIQGGEVAALQGAPKKLRETVAIQAEISFVPLYQDQPTFGEVDQLLRSYGFLPHCFAAVKRWPIGQLVVNGDPRRAFNQLLEADIVYVRDFYQIEMMTNEQLKHLTMIMHYCYRSYDLCLRCISELQARHAVIDGSAQRYLELISPPKSPSATAPSS